jgi:Fe2+ transport system protein FeoA
MILALLATKSQLSMTPEPDIRLCCLPRGADATVVAVEGGDDVARRLADLGLVPGTRLEMLTVAPLGDPILFRLLGYRLALRKDEAERVMVRPVGRLP